MVAIIVFKPQHYKVAVQNADVLTYPCDVPGHRMVVALTHACLTPTTVTLLKLMPTMLSLFDPSSLHI